MKRLLINCSILLALTLLLSLDAPAQIKIDRNAGKINPTVKKAAEKQAAIDKVLNATVSKVEFKIRKIPAYIGTTSSVFYDRRIDLKENNNVSFILKEKITKEPQRIPNQINKEPFDEIYTFTPNTTTRYKDLLSNGFMVNIDFTQHKGFVFYGDFIFTFYFTDGTVAPVYLQEIVNFSMHGHYKAGHTDELHVSKNMPGSVFPDPANPLVLPPIK